MTHSFMHQRHYGQYKHQQQQQQPPQHRWQRHHRLLLQSSTLEESEQTEERRTYESPTVASDEDREAPPRLPFLLTDVDLRTASHAEVQALAWTFVEGFYQGPSLPPEMLPLPRSLLAPLAEAKAEAIMERFQEADGGGGSEDLRKFEQLPACMVKATATRSGALAGTVAIMGCLKVTDETGSRILSGREAETFRNGLADETPE